MDERVSATISDDRTSGTTATEYFLEDLNGDGRVEA